MLTDPQHGPVIRDTLTHAVAITVFHDAMRQQLIHHLPDLAPRVHCVPNGFDLLEAPTNDSRLRYGIPADACVWVSLAGLREVKRPDFPILQLAQLVGDYPHLRFLRAGPELEPETAARVRALADRYSWVQDCGIIAHDAVGSLLHAGNVFVSASRSEGMPHAVREAMGCGLALLLSDIPGHRAMAEPEQEALFFDSAASFQTAARRLIESLDLRRRLGEAARQRVTAECAAQDEIGAYLALFGTLTPCQGKRI
jgi:glycosyltransferase involved in cell wall biosynthesis